MIITADMLLDLSACTEQVDLFREVFGFCAEITPENLRFALDNGIDIWWLRLDVDAYKGESFNYEVSVEDYTAKLECFPYTNFEGEVTTDCELCDSLVEIGGGLDALLKSYSAWLNKIVSTYLYR